MKFNVIVFTVFSSVILSFLSFTRADIKILSDQFQLPVLKKKANNPIVRIKITTSSDRESLTNLNFSTKGTSDLADIKTARLYYYAKDSLPGNMETTKATLVATIDNIQKELRFKSDQVLQKGDNYFWLSYELSDNADVLNFVDAKLLSVQIDGKS